jgi:DNA-binding transcriptional LysR family regulator
MSAITDLRIFVKVVDRGGFAAASKDLGLTPSAVSKLVSRLEDRLGARLLHRTTRRLALTPEGETYHARARDILAAIEDAEAEVSRSGQRPRGRLRVSCCSFATHLMPVMPDFTARFPEVELEFAITDRVVDLLAENGDVAIRIGTVQDPSLVARKVTEVRRGLFAAPSYLASHGSPRRPDDLRDHDCIVTRLVLSSHRWPFREGGQERVVEVGPRVQVDSGYAALQLAIAGGGIVRLTDMIVAQAVREGRLEPVLSESHVVQVLPLSVVHPQGRQRMPKVRAFLDFIVERFSHPPWRGALAPEPRREMASEV